MVVAGSSPATARQGTGRNKDGRLARTFTLLKLKALSLTGIEIQKNEYVN
jgi:hypothetical protein